MKYKIGIVGSSHAPTDLFVPYIRNILKPFRGIPDYWLGFDGFSLISGGAKGADTATRIVAKELGIPIDEYLPNYKEYPNRLDAYRARNKVIAMNSDEIFSLALPFNGTKCIHCERFNKDSHHQKTGGCWTGSMKGKWNVIVCSSVVPF